MRASRATSAGRRTAPPRPPPPPPAPPPAAKARVLVGAEQQIELIARPLGAQRGERVDGVRRGARIELAPVDLVGRLAFQRELEHRQTILRARDGRLAIARLAGRNPENALEIEALARRAGDREMRVVHRVECAAQDPQLNGNTRTSAAHLAVADPHALLRGEAPG